LSTGILGPILVDILDKRVYNVIVEQRGMDGEGGRHF
jgi:hypothetical protein